MRKTSHFPTALIQWRSRLNRNRANSRIRSPATAPDSEAPSSRPRHRRSVIRGNPGDALRCPPSTSGIDSWERCLWLKEGLRGSTRPDLQRRITRSTQNQRPYPYVGSSSHLSIHPNLSALSLWSLRRRLSGNHKRVRFFSSSRAPTESIEAAGCPRGIRRRRARRCSLNFPTSLPTMRRPGHHRVHCRRPRSKAFPEKDSRRRPSTLVFAQR